MFNFAILIDKIMYTPKDIIIIPPIWFNVPIKSPAISDSTVFIMTPRIENTTENPVTKNIVFSITDERLICTVALSLKPDMVVPDMYARNAGITGRIHGATNEARPAATATIMLISAMTSSLQYAVKNICYKFASKIYFRSKLMDIL